MNKPWSFNKGNVHGDEATVIKFAKSFGYHHTFSEVIDNLLSIIYIYKIEQICAEKKSRSARFSQAMSEALVQAYAKQKVSYDV